LKSKILRLTAWLGICETPGGGREGELLMPQVNADDLIGRLKKGKPIPAILLLGEEPYLRDSCARN